MLTQPTVFHITHPKAGSQWVREILKHAAPRRFQSWQVVQPHARGGRGVPTFYLKPLVPGAVYATVYLRRQTFQSVLHGTFVGDKTGLRVPALTAWLNRLNFDRLRQPIRCFVILRDLRDTLVSYYFSKRYSGAIVADINVVERNMMEALDTEAALLWLLEERMDVVAGIQESWIDAPDALVLRYEDILGNEYDFFQRLIDYCEIRVPAAVLHDIVHHNIFERATGRPRGQEDPRAHIRKGIRGDWRNHFTDRLKAEFKQRFGQLLIKTGYEKDLNW